MPHRKPVTRITAKDNPEEKAPRYPGKFRRNNEQGVIYTKDEWLEIQTDLWLQHMVKNPAFEKTYTADKALTLQYHLSKSLLPGSQDYPKCRKLLLKSEQKLQSTEKQQDDQQPENKQNQQNEEEEQGHESEGGNMSYDGVEERGCDSWDSDWTPDEEKGRTVNEFAVEKKESYAQNYLNTKTDEELFQSFEEVSSEMKKTSAYKKREQEYTAIYFSQNCENNTSTEFLLSVPELPEVVRRSKLCSDKVGHLNKKEKK